MTSSELIPKVVDLVMLQAEKHPERIALQLKDEPGITHHQLKEAIFKRKSDLSRYVDKQGTRIILLGHSSPDWIIAFLAAMAAGATVVPLDPNLEESDIRKLILRSEPFLIMASIDVLKKFSKGLFEICPTVCIDDNFALSSETNEIKYTVDDRDGKIGALLYTSGTTGNYKGVLLTHEGFIEAVTGALKAVPLKETDVVLCVLPAHHIFGLVAVLLVPLAAGAEIVSVKQLIGSEIIETMQKYHPSIFVGVPRLLDLLGGKILHQAHTRGKIVAALFNLLLWLSKLSYRIGRLLGFEIPLGKILFSNVHKAFGGNLRRIVSGGAALSERTYMLFSALGFIVIEGYGMTETTALIAVNRNNTRKPGCVGEIVDGIALQFLNHRKVGDGEICVKGKAVMQSYFRDLNETQNATEDGWFKTGDLGHLDDKQRLVITGRIKELIILSSGKNISPDIVEQNYQGLPFTQEISLVGLPSMDPIGGEEMHAVVVINPESYSGEIEEEIKEKIKQEIVKRSKNLPSWWNFKKIHFMTSLPKTTTLKVKRKLLRDQLMKGKE